MLPLADRPVLTVENYCKWYTLYVLWPEDNITSQVSFDLLEPYQGKEPAYCDHVPNPRAVELYTEAQDIDLHSEALEMIIGRWELEYKNNYWID